MGTLIVKDLTFRSRHGYHDFEREIGNYFEVDLMFRTDLVKAGHTDNLEDTLDYAPATAVVEGVMHGESVRLIETLLAKIGAHIMEAFPQVNFLEVRLRKLKPPIRAQCAYVEIVDEWHR